MDLQDKISMGAALFGSSAIDRGASTALAEVASNAENGEVTVYMKDENGNEQKITIPCDGDLRAGDTATVIIQEGTATAISASGAGERSKKETATAQETATTAQNTAEDAASAATTAQTTAEDAASAATTAQTTAENAASAATTAQTTAENAAADASAAKTKAEDAASAANVAKTEAKASAEVAVDAKDTAQIAALAARIAQTTAEDAASAATTAQTTAEKADKKAQAAADDATSAKNTAETAASDALAAKKTATTAATTAQQASADAKAAADKAEEEAQRAQDAEKKITANVDKVQSTADQAVSDIAAEVTRAQTAEQAVEKIANDTKTYAEGVQTALDAEVKRAQEKEQAASDAASSAQSSASQAAKDAQAAGVSASLAQSALEATVGTFERDEDGNIITDGKGNPVYKNKYFYHDDEGAHVISGDMTDPTRLDLTNDSLTISEGGAKLASFTSDEITLARNKVNFTAYDLSVEGVSSILVDLDAKNEVTPTEESSKMVSGAQIVISATGKTASQTLTTELGRAQVYYDDDTQKNMRVTMLGYTDADLVTVEGKSLSIGENPRSSDYPKSENINIIANTAISLNAQTVTINDNTPAYYPVGSIYMSLNSTSPATLFGGTWARLQDRFLVGAGSKYKLDSIGGSASHSHTVSAGSGNTGAASSSSTGSASLVTDSASNIPPYLAVYMWTRMS